MTDTPYLDPLDPEWVHRRGRWVRTQIVSRFVIALTVDVLALVVAVTVDTPALSVWVVLGLLAALLAGVAVWFGYTARAGYLQARWHDRYGAARDDLDEWFE